MIPPAVSALLAFLVSLFRSRRALHLKILAREHQVAVYQWSVPRPRLQPTDRLFWSWLSRLWADWQEALAFVQPRGVIAWQREALSRALVVREPTQKARPARCCQ